MKRLCVPLIMVFATCAALCHAHFQSTPQRYDVSIQSLQFSPPSLTIHVGDTVVWTNNDDRDYNVVSKDGSFKSGNLRNGQTFEYVFSHPGKISYQCSYHPRMKGTITVLP